MRYFKISWIAIIVSLSTITGAQQMVREGKYWIGSFSKSFPVTQKGTLLIAQVRGNVEITTWNRNEVRIEGALKMDIASKENAGFALEETKEACLTVGDTVEIQGGRFSRGWIQSRFKIRIPKQFGCDIGLQSGSVTGTGLAGPVTARTGGGQITLSDIIGPCYLKTDGGTITLTQIQKEVTASSGGGPIEISQVKERISANTGGGDIRLGFASNGATLTTGGGEITVLDSKGEIKIQTGGGDIHTARINGNLNGSTGGGAVKAEEIAGSVELRTQGGDINLVKIKGAIHARTGGGNIDAECMLNKLTGDQEMRLQSGNGNLVISLSNEISCTIDARVRYAGFRWQPNQISSEFPLSINSTEDGISASGNINGGGPTIWLETRDGNIQIKNKMILRD